MAELKDIYKRVISKLPNPEAWDPLTASGLIIDTETTGFVPLKNRLVNIGLCPMIDGKIDLGIAHDAYLHTPYDPEVWGTVYSHHRKAKAFVSECEKAGVWNQELRDKIDHNSGSCVGVGLPDHIENLMDNTGNRMFQTAVDITKISHHKTTEPGVALPRDVVLEMVYNMINEAQANGQPIIGHNLRFDLHFLMEEMAEIGLDLELDDNLILDTGGLVKAGQMGEMPRPNETLCDYFMRVAAAVRRIKWSLDRYCVPAFGLTKYGVDTSEQHKSAAYDCWVTGCLLQEIAKEAA